jgi:hypothetical protein
MANTVASHVRGQYVWTSDDVSSGNTSPSVHPHVAWYSPPSRGRLALSTFEGCHERASHEAPLPCWSRPLHLEIHFVAIYGLINAGRWTPSETPDGFQDKHGSIRECVASGAVGQCVSATVAAGTSHGEHFLLQRPR